LDKATIWQPTATRSCWSASSHVGNDMIELLLFIPEQMSLADLERALVSAYTKCGLPVRVFRKSPSGHRQLQVNIDFRYLTVVELPDEEWPLDEGKYVEYCHEYRARFPIASFFQLYPGDEELLRVGLREIALRLPESWLVNNRDVLRTVPEFLERWAEVGYQRVLNA
jgi:hypothetical protein